MGAKSILSPQTNDPGRQNTIVVAACSAVAHKAPLLIIVEGKKYVGELDCC
jgi:hypothetical protein